MGRQPLPARRALYILTLGRVMAFLLPAQLHVNAPYEAAEDGPSDWMLPPICRVGMLDFWLVVAI